jgi:hypothetical protein
LVYLVPKNPDSTTIGIPAQCKAKDCMPCQHRICQECKRCNCKTARPCNMSYTGAGYTHLRRAQGPEETPSSDFGAENAVIILGQYVVPSSSRRNVGRGSNDAPSLELWAVPTSTASMFLEPEVRSALPLKMCQPTKAWFWLNAAFGPESCLSSLPWGSRSGNTSSPENSKLYGNPVNSSCTSTELALITATGADTLCVCLWKRASGTA